MPLFSIIVPIYKVEPYLRRCVDSILAQTFRDFELILVDDGSPDGCPAICDEYAKHDSRIRVIHQSNGGLSAARNAGLDAATGKYIVFCDGDDAIRENLLEEVIPYLDQYELVSYGADYLFPDGRIQPDSVDKTSSFSLFSVPEKICFFVNAFLPCKIGFEACFKVFRKAVIDQFHLRFEDNKKIFAEDVYFGLCYCSHIQSVIRLDKRLYLYYQRADSIMGQEKGKRNLGRFSLLSEAYWKHLSAEGPEALLAAYPILHYRIILDAIGSFWIPQTVKTLPSEIRKEVSNPDFFFPLLKDARKDLNLLNVSRMETSYHYNLIQYLISGRFIYFIKLICLVKLKTVMHRWFAVKRRLHKFFK